MSRRRRQEPTGLVLQHFQQDEPAWKEVESLLPSGWRQLAVEQGFSRSTQDPALGDKLRMLFVLVASSLSLRFTVALFAGAGRRTVSHVALHTWFREAVSFLAALLVELTEAHRFAGSRWAGYRVRAIDATTVQRPGAKGTTARVHYALQLNDMTLAEAQVTDEKVGESFVNFKSGKGILDIADRGYSNAPSLAAAVDQGGDFLVRLNYSSLPLFRSGEPHRLQLRRLCDTLAAPQIDEWKAEIRPKGHPAIPVRLIIAKLPEDKAREARARTRQEHDGKPSAEALYFAGFVLLVTTVPRKRLGTARIVELYRLRWQVELEFKRHKSIGGLDLLPNFLPETIASWILVKLILAEFARRLVSIPVMPRSNSGPRPAEVSGDPGSCAPWEAAVLAWTILRQSLFRFPATCQELRAFLPRFLAHLIKLKACGRKRRRQIQDFLSHLSPCALSLPAAP